MPFCNECGTDNPEGSKFCSKCGTTMGAVAEAPPVPESAPATAPPPVPPQPVPEPPPKKKRHTLRNIALAIFLIFLCYVAVALTLANRDTGKVSTRTGSAATTTGRTMYFCGIDRCKNSGEYGELILVTGINVWRYPGPNRGRVEWKATNGQRVTVLETRRVGAKPGELWYRLEKGGWANDLWLTDARCTKDNYQKHALDDC